MKRLYLFILILLTLFLYRDAFGQAEIQLEYWDFETGLLTDWEKEGVFSFGDLIINSTSPIDGVYDMYGYANSSFSCEDIKLTRDLVVVPGETYGIRFTGYSYGDGAWDAYLRITSRIGTTTATVGWATDHPTDLEMIESGYAGRQTYNATFFNPADTDVSIRFTFCGGFGNRRIYVDNVEFYQVSSNTINIESPLDGQLVTPPFDVVWTGIGDYTEATVNGVPAGVGDTTYTITSASEGAFDIIVASVADPATYDSISVNIFDSGDIRIDTAYTVDNTAYYQVVSSAVDSLAFYIGTDTLDMSYLGKAYPPAGLTDALYSFTLIENVHNPAGTWYKVYEDKDTVTIVPNLTWNNLGQISSTNLICWSNTGSPIEVNGQLDLGCGWVNNMTYTCTYAFLQLTNSTIPSYSQSEESLSKTQRVNLGVSGCLDPLKLVRTTFQAINTVTSDTTTELYAETPEFNNGGSASVTYAQRIYEMIGEEIWITDLVNSVQQKIGDIPSSAVLSQSSLWLFEYTTNQGVVEHTGTIADGLERLDTPIILLFDDADYKRAWSFDTYTQPTSVAQAFDSYFSSFSTSFTRTYFRGVHPKILKNGVL